MKIEMNTKILEPIKEKIIRKYNLNKKLINLMNENSQKIYIDDLINKEKSKLKSSYGYITIDKSYVKIDSNGTINIKEELREELISQLGHELLHASTLEINRGGITNRYRNHYALNEGITQMFADEISEHSNRKYSGDYEELDIIARIIRLCIGKKIIEDAYFNGNTNKLESECNKLAQNNNFYNILNKKLNSIIEFQQSHPNKKEEDKRKYQILINECFNYLLANIVEPKLNSIYLKSNKIKLINSIINIISEGQPQKELLIILNNYLNQINIEKRQIKR